MDNKSVYTTGEAAKFLHVHQTTVIDWIEKGLIGSYRTPGGHRRIQRGALLQFLHTHRMPVPGSLKEGPGHVPLVGVEPERHVHDAYQMNPYGRQKREAR